jgi:hypothetical protein
MHPRFKAICRHVLWLLPLAILLSFSQAVPGAWAQAGLYSGPTKFTVTITQLNNQGKFATKTQKVLGTLELYLVESGTQLIPGLIPDTSYFMRFIDSNNNLVFGIDKLAAVKTQHGAGSSSLKGVGTGTFFHQDNGVVDPNITGPVYLDFSGTVVKDKKTGNIKKIAMTSKAAGGIFYVDPDNADNNVNYTWKASPAVTLTFK